MLANLIFVFRIFPRGKYLSPLKTVEVSRPDPEAVKVADERGGKRSAGQAERDRANYYPRIARKQ
jgi:hypothetical protein